MNQNISTMDIMLAPTHKPIIPPMLEIRLVLFQRVEFCLNDNNNKIMIKKLTQRLIFPARFFRSKVL